MVVRGEQVYLDANFLVAIAWQPHIWHASANVLQEHLAERNIKLTLSSLALNEAIFQLKSLEQKARQKADAKPAPVAAPQPSAETEEDDLDFYDDEDEDDYARYNPRYKPVPQPPAPKPNIPEWSSALELALGKLPNVVQFEPPDLDFHRAVINGVRKMRLDPTDAFHYAAARRLNCPIVTNDAGFQRIGDVNLVVVTFF
jgi:predicted nucleic acid-binding protein